MEVNSLDQLIRSEPTAAASTRRANDPGSNPFSSLLDARTERARPERPERALSSAKPANSPSIKTRKSESDDAPDKPAHAEAKDRPAPKEHAGRSARAQAADKAERPAASEPKRDGADGQEAKEPVAAPDTDNAAVAAVGDKTADADALAAADATADTVAVSIAVDHALNDAALPVAAQTVAQTADAPQPVAAAIAAQLETLAAAPETAADAATAATSAIVAPPPVDAKKLDAAAAAAAAEAQEIAKPTSTLSEQQAAADANAGEDYADFMLRNLAAAPAVSATEKDAAKADPKAKETAWTVTIAPSAMATAPVAPTTALAVQAAADAEAATAIDGNASKTPVADDAVDAKPAAKTAEATAQFAQHLDPSRDVRAAEELRAPPRPAAPPAHEQVAVHVRKAVAEGLDQITIRLNPAELGRIEVKIEVGNDGTLRAAFAADKQMTLDLLKGDSRQLEQALSEAGLSTDAGGLNFSLRGDNRENAQAFRQLGEEFARNRADDPAAIEAPAPLAAGSYARRNAGPGRIDLNA